MKTPGVPICRRYNKEDKFLRCFVIHLISLYLDPLGKDGTSIRENID